ncbi:MAG TPA: sensor domain-containing diguanylate cyclase [Gammaproteobacteria bacterium]|nr:sensor domain-containing diguanylate cyclase [Gammaproteobacteria bacterium]
MNVELVRFFQEQKESLDMILDLIPVPVFTKDKEGRYLSCNTAFEEFIGVSRRKLMGKGVYDLWPGPQADIYHAKDKELFDNPGIQIYETSVITTSGSETSVQFHKATFLDAKGQVAGLLGVIFDRTKEKTLENKLKHLALVDTLTGLRNRRAGIEAVNRLISESARKQRAFSMAMMDIDHFKKINDTWGHAGGDRVLESVQGICKGILREYDFIFRYGGEEFMLCFPDSHSEETREIAERLRTAFESSPIVVGGEDSVQVTVSIGIASYPEHGDDVEDLTRACDSALYAAKHSGRNRVRLA